MDYLKMALDARTAIVEDKADAWCKVFRDFAGRHAREGRLEFELCTDHPKLERLDELFEHDKIKEMFIEPLRKESIYVALGRGYYFVTFERPE